MTPVEVQQYIQAITTGLSPLGEKVATGAKEYYALAYRQSILDGVEALVACGAALFVLWRIWKGYERAKAKDEYCEKEGWFFALTFSSLILGIFTAVMFCTGIDHIGNPGYQAIQSMLGSITGKGK